MTTSEQSVLISQASVKTSRWRGVLPHAAVFVAGSLALIASAFYGVVWFDESYSVAIASHSFADIWSIGSADVHPVLYYWCLHALYLVFGSNILVYRLFSVCGIVLCALFGLTHIRRDFGGYAGMLFTAFVVLSPYTPQLGLQIRMYGWAAFAVMVACVYALRIYRVVRTRATNATGTEQDRVGSTRVPNSWWAILFIASLAAAYLHYFATIAAFVVNVLLLVGLIAHRRVCRHELVVLIAGAIVLVALFVPWLTALAGQASYVSQHFWIRFKTPESLVELVGFPLVTSLVWDILAGDYGIIAQVVVLIVVVGVVACGVYLIVNAVVCLGICRSCSPDVQLKGAVADTGHDLSGWAAPLIGYAGMIVMAAILGALLGQVILYSRYLFIAVGPFLLAMAILCAHKNNTALTAGVLIGALVLACLNYGILTYKDYDAANEEAITYYTEAVAHAQGENADEKALVVSDDIGIAGVLAVMCPDIEQVYLDVYKTREAYAAYEPTLDIVDSLDEAIEGFSGYFVWLSTSAQRDKAQEFASQYDAQIVEWRTFYYSYNDIDFTIALMQR